MTGISVVGGGSRSPYRMPGCLRVVTFIALFLDLDQKNTTGGAYQTGIALTNTDLSLVSDDSWTDSTAPGSCIAAVRAG